jgi:hypothetical protein
MIAQTERARNRGVLPHEIRASDRKGKRAATIGPYEMGLPRKPPSRLTGIGNSCICYVLTLEKWREGQGDEVLWTTKLFSLF